MLLEDAPLAWDWPLTWSVIGDLYELRVHKRLIDLNAPTEVVKSVIVNSKNISATFLQAFHLTVVQSRQVSRWK
jgi:hypothetical protein